MKVYTVFGTTGEYSDLSTWPVISYLSEESAKEHVIRADLRAKEWEIARKSQSDYMPAGFSCYDPKPRSMDYNGIEYDYQMTEIADYPTKTTTAKYRTLMTDDVLKEWDKIRITFENGRYISVEKEV